MTPQPVCTLEDFHAFFTVHAYDTIGNGTFRRYLHDSKDQSEPWAIELTQRTERVVSANHALATLITSVQRETHPLADLLTTAMSHQHPIKLPPPTDAGVDVTDFVQCVPSTPTGRVYISPEHASLTGFAWLATNAARVVRAIVTVWFDNLLDTPDTSEGEETYEGVARRMEAATKEDATRLYRLYTAAHASVVAAIAGITRDTPTKKERSNRARTDKPTP